MSSHHDFFSSELDYRFVLPQNNLSFMSNFNQYFTLAHRDSSLSYLDFNQKF
jgi:hypothetical protein